MLQSRHSRWNRSHIVFTPRYNGWSHDPDFCDIGCFVCDKVLVLGKAAVSLGFRSPSAKIGVGITDLRPHAESERNKIVKAELERGFAIVPKRHPLHMKGMTETLVFCRAVLEWLQREATEQELLGSIGCMSLTLIGLSVRTKPSNIVNFRQQGEDRDQALTRMIYEASRQEYLL